MIETTDWVNSNRKTIRVNGCELTLTSIGELEDEIIALIKRKIPSEARTKECISMVLKGVMDKVEGRPLVL